MIPQRLVPRLRTGCLVFFIGRGPVPSLIRLGSWAGAEWRGELRIVRPVAHHVEVFETHPYDGPVLWGAHASAGFVPKPIDHRLAGLTLNRDYRVLLLDDLTPARQAAVRAKLRELWGAEYEDWWRVLRVYRKGNRRVTVERFCSESALECEQAALFAWAMGRDDENESPLSLEAVASQHGVYLTEDA